MSEPRSWRNMPLVERLRVVPLSFLLYILVFIVLGRATIRVNEG